MTFIFTTEERQNNSRVFLTQDLFHRSSPAQVNVIAEISYCLHSQSSGNRLLAICTLHFKVLSLK